MSPKTETATARATSFSALEKWVLASLSTLPVACLLLFTDGLHGIASHWL